MENKIIINIGRQLGSGGILVAKKISQKLNIDFYDKEILNIAAKETGIGEEFFSNSDEKRKFDFLGRFFSIRSTVESEIWNSNNFLSAESLFKIQSETIKKIAKTKSAIFVGRGADYVLRDNENCFNIFLSANIDDRIKRIAENKNISEGKAKLLIEKTDKSRAKFYNYFTDKIWGNANSYHLCLNTSFIGIDNVVDIIIEIVNEKFINK